METEKILVSHRQPYDNTIIITIYRECYDIKRHVGILYIFFLTSSFVSNFVCLREIIAGFDIDESYNYAQHVI